MSGGKGFGGIRHVTEAIQRNDTAFGTRVADNTVNRIDIPGTYPFNTGRHRFLENGTFRERISDLSDSNALTDLAGKFQVRATEGDEHIFGSRERVRYVPNYELMWGAAAWADSTLQDGQHFAIELSNEAGDNGYRYHFAGTASGYDLTLEQFKGSTTAVDSDAADTDDLDKHGFDPTEPSVARDKLSWYGAGISEYELSYSRRRADNSLGPQENRRVGRTANDTDVATDEINLTIQLRVWVDSGSGADPITVNLCSVGALIRGNARQVDREKPAIFYDLGGSISQYPTDNQDQGLAARIDPDRRQVVTAMQPPLFIPSGSGVTMEVTVYAVHKDNSDLTVNFDDPDDDGTDEGPSPAAQGRSQTDVMQYTRDITSIPTTSDIRADGTTGQVPDMRQLTTTIGTSSGGNNPGNTTAGELAGIKRLVYPEDVVVFLPRTYPGGSTTGGSIKWLKPIFEQDW